MFSKRNCWKGLKNETSTCILKHAQTQKTRNIFYTPTKRDAKNEKTRIFEKTCGIKLQKLPWLEVVQSSYPEKKHAANEHMEN